MNQADSEKINMMLLQSGFAKTDDFDAADVVLLNTCSVRKKGEDKVFSLIKRVKILNKSRKEGQKMIIGLTGCMVRKTGMHQKYLSQETKRTTASKITYIEEKEGIFNHDDVLFPRTDGLDFTLRIEEIKYLSFILSHIYGEKIGNDDYLKMKQLREHAYTASVIVQTWCDNFCSFCIVPYTRGREISRSEDDILQEIRELAQKWTKEIYLVGQNVNSYGKQKNLKLWNEEKSRWNSGIGTSPFRTLLNEIDKIPGIDRLRFTSSNPHDMTQDILDAHFELWSTCNYLHFALQSGNDNMLKRMNRRHTYADFKKMVEYLRSRDPLFSVSTDIIVGYSGETDEMFQDTYQALEELEIDFAYIARYSVRNGTLASRIYPDDISDALKAERWHILNNLLEKNVARRSVNMIHSTQEILIAGKKDDMFFGRTRNFKEVFFPVSVGVNIGDLVQIRITDLDNWVLRGEITSVREPLLEVR